MRPSTRPRTRRLPAARNVIVVLTLALAAAGLGALSASAQGNEDNITICHRTNSATNPYVSITVDQSAVDGIAGNSGGQPDHFGEHVGPLASSEAVAQALKDAGIEWGDIIPAIPGVHGGRNLGGGGQAILDNDCNFVTPPTTTPPTAPPTTAPPETAPPRTAPPAPPGPAAAPPAPAAAPAAPVAGQPRGVTG